MTTLPRGNGNIKAFYAHLYDEAGIVTKLDKEIVFFPDAGGDLITIEPDMCNFLTVLAEVGLADTQQIVDKIRGGYAAIACRRDEGRS